MKKYRLLRDLPGVKAGAVSKVRNFDDRIVYFFGEMAIPESELDFHPDWFEEVKPWRPKKGEIFYFVSSLLEIECATWAGHNWEEYLFLVGNIFPSKEKAMVLRDRFMEAAKVYNAELDGV